MMEPIEEIENMQGARIELRPHYSDIMSDKPDRWDVVCSSSNYMNPKEAREWANQIIKAAEEAEKRNKALTLQTP